MSLSQWLAGVFGRPTRPQAAGRRTRLRLEALEDRTVPAIGALDPTFGTQGIALVNSAVGNTFQANAVAVQADGKVVLAGFAVTGTGQDIMVARLNPNGSLDTGFANGGVFVSSFNGNDFATDVAVQGDKIVVAATASNGGNNDILLLRLTAGGALDTTFGTLNPANPTLRLGFGTFDSGRDDSSGRLATSGGLYYVAGTVSNGGNNDLALVRFDGLGLHDNSFGTTTGPSGQKFFSRDFGATDSGSAVAVQGSQFILVGTSFNGATNDLVAVRVTPTGGLDTSFNPGVGFFRGDLGSTDTGNAVAVQSDGRIVLAGQSFNGSNFDGVITRLNSGGSLDTTFNNNNGFIKIDSAGRNENIVAIALGAGDQIIAVGSSTASGDSDLLVARVNANGTPDTTFGTGGVTVQNAQFANDQLFGAAVQPDGMIVAAGVSGGAGTGSKALAARFSVTPDVPPGGGGGGGGGGTGTPNRAPVNAVPRRLTVVHGKTVAFRVGVSDPDAGAASVRVTLSVTAGKLSLKTLRIAGVTVAGNKSRTVTLTGSLSALNRALAGVIYSAPGKKGLARISVITNDLGHTGTGGAKVDLDTIAVTVR